jgi:hypothetical protein
MHAGYFSECSHIIWASGTGDLNIAPEGDLLLEIELVVPSRRISLLELQAFTAISLQAFVDLLAAFFLTRFGESILAVDEAGEVSIVFWIPCHFDSPDRDAPLVILFRSHQEFRSGVDDEVELGTLRIGREARWRRIEVIGEEPGICHLFPNIIFQRRKIIEGDLDSQVFFRLLHHGFQRLLRIFECGAATKRNGNAQVKSYARDHFHPILLGEMVNCAYL